MNMYGHISYINIYFIYIIYVYTYLHISMHEQIFTKILVTNLNILIILIIQSKLFLNLYLIKFKYFNKTTLVI